MTASTSTLATFQALHRSGTFIMPNPWDVGSARYLEWRGFPALATTSSGFAASLGRADMEVTRGELVAHVAALTAAVSVPINVDTEYCFADDLAGIATTVRLMAEAGAAGCSIEDFNPTTGRIDEPARATERVAAAAEAAAAHGLMLTARTENYLHGRLDLEDTIQRLSAFVEAGAPIVYAPGVIDGGEIAQVIAAVDAPLNVLALPNGPTVREFTDLGVRRVSTGGSLAWAALAGLGGAIDQILGDEPCNFQTTAFAATPVSGRDRAQFLGPPTSG